MENKNMNYFYADWAGLAMIGILDVSKIFHLCNFNVFLNHMYCLVLH